MNIVLSCSLSLSPSLSPLTLPPPHPHIPSCHGTFLVSPLPLLWCPSCTALSHVSPEFQLPSGYWPFLNIFFFFQMCHKLPRFSFAVQWIYFVHCGTNCAQHRAVPDLIQKSPSCPLLPKPCQLCPIHVDWKRSHSHSSWLPSPCHCWTHW